MYQKIQGWISTLHQNTEQYRQLFFRLNEKNLNFKPNPDAWSIGQVIEHVIKANESYYPVVERLRAGKAKFPFLAKLPFIRKLFGKMILMGVEPTRRRRSKTFPVWIPVMSDFKLDITERFLRHHEEFEKFIRSCSDLLERRAYISSPANKSIVYDLEMAFEILLNHEIRHLNQALEVLEIYEQKI